MAMLSPRMKTRLGGIKEVCRERKGAALLWDDIRDMILDAVPSDFGTFGVMDPVTGLFIDGYSFGDRPERADTYISRFYLQREYYSYLDLRARGECISHASQFTGGRLERDPVYAEWLGPEGFKHGARVCFVSGGYYWGGLCMIRGDDVPDFNEKELNLLRELVEPVGTALRTAAAWEQAHSLNATSEISPGVALPDSGVLLLDHRRRVLFRTEGVQPILDDMVAGDVADAKGPLHRVGGGLPGVLHAVSAKLRMAMDHGQTTNNPSVTLRGRSQWWTLTATVPEEGMSEEVATVLIIARSHPRDAAPVLFAAYGLTEREREIVQLVRLGMSTARIARHIFVSPYTVQDHLKNVFAKVGVRTRGELLALIFREESPVGRLVAKHENEPSLRLS